VFKAPWIVILFPVVVTAPVKPITLISVASEYLFITVALGEASVTVSVSPVST